jgi:hypothetical protein
MFNFDSSTTILLRKAQETSTPESKSLGTDDVINVKDYKSKQQYLEQQKKENDPINKALDTAQDIAQNQGQQAEQLTGYLKERSLVVRWMKNVKGYSEGDIKNIESLPYPPTTIWESAYTAMNASIESGVEDFKALFDLSLQSYANNPNKEATKYLVTEAAKLQGEHLNIPQILQGLRQVSKGEDAQSIIENSEWWFGEEFGLSDKYDALLSLAAPQYVDSLDAANAAYQRAKDVLDRSRINMNIARGVADMLQSAPFMQQEARMIDWFRGLFGMAVSTPFVRAWSGIFRSLQVGENLKKQFEVSIQGEKSEQDMSIKTNSALNRKVLAQQVENPLPDFIQKFKQNQNNIVGALNRYPEAKQYEQGVNSFIQALDIISSTNLEDKNSQPKLSEAGKLLGQAQNILPKYQVVPGNNQTAKSRSNVRIAADPLSLVASGIGSIGLSTAVDKIVEFLGNGNLVNALSVISIAITFILQLISQSAGSAVLPSLTTQEMQSLDKMEDTLFANSKEKNDLRRLKQNVKQFLDSINKNQEMIDSTIKNMVDIGAGKSNDTVVGSPEQAYLRYNQIKKSTEQALKDVDTYVNSCSRALSANTTIDPDTKAVFERNLLSIRNNRQTIINFYGKISGVANIAKEIQQKSVFLREMESLDKGAEIISNLYGPTALSSALIGSGGVLEKAEQIIQKEEEALQKLLTRKQEIQGAAGSNSDPNKDITKEQAELAAVEENIKTRKYNLQTLRGWYMSQNPYAGEYKSFMSIANSVSKFRRVYSAEIFADQKNVDYVGDYYNEVFEKSKDKPEFGEAIKNPSKWRKVPTTEI